MKTFHGSVRQWDKALRTTSQCGNEGHALKGLAGEGRACGSPVRLQLPACFAKYTMGVVALQEWKPALHSATSEWEG